MVNVAVVIGSTRPGRLGLRVSKLVESYFVKAGHTVSLVDPLEHNLPFLDGRHQWLKAAGTRDPPALDTLSATFRASDAIVVVSPEYNYSVPPPLANLLNYFFVDEFGRKPGGVVSYSPGAFGGSRVTVPLRTLLAGLGMAVVPGTVAVPAAATVVEEGGAVAAAADAVSRKLVDENLTAFVDEVGWYAEALKAAREGGVNGKL
ncbi:flavoprotein-like protein [Zopfochytrium polystomum]|nr:flavoprotein-like protein [Zopfochytrium polystomum]